MAVRGQYSKGKTRRREILRGAVRVFSKLGSGGASMKAIAADVGIGPALLQYYFPSRENLLLAVITEWDEENERRSIGEPVFARWQRSMAHNSTVPGLIHLYTTTLVEAIDEDHPAKIYFFKRYLDATHGVTAELILQQYRGSLPSELDPERIARLLLAASEGLQIRWLHDPSFKMEEEFGYLLESLGISNRD